MPQKDYTYAYKNIRNELEGIRNTLRHMQNNNIPLTTEMQELRAFELNEVMSSDTSQSLSTLHRLFDNIMPQLRDDRDHSMLKLRIERLDYPDLQNFIRDIERDLRVTTEESPRVVYQQEYNEEYGAIIMKPYQLIDGALHPCHIDANGHVTLLGMDADGS
jgi:predicted nuclease with TOPRIM domain